MRQYLSDLDVEKAKIFMALMRDQRAQRCLVHTTLGFPSAITPDNAERILEEVRLSTAHEVNVKAAAREVELQQRLSDVERTHKDELLDRDAEVFRLQDRMRLEDEAAARELAAKQEAYAERDQELRRIRLEVKADIDRRIQQAASEARTATARLKGLLVIAYASLVALTAWYTADDLFLRALIAVATAVLGFWFVPGVLYVQIAIPVWRKRFELRAKELGVSDKLFAYSIEERLGHVAAKANLDNLL